MAFQFGRINATLRRIRDSRDGTKAEIELWVEKDGKHKTILNQHLNLLAIRSRNELVKELCEIIQNDKWYHIIKTICERTVYEFRKGADPKKLSGCENNLDTNFLVEPLVYENKANMIYGAGSSLKSYWALILGMVIQNPPQNDFFGMKIKQANTLYLDYEGDEEEINRRVRTIQKTLNLPLDTNILYRESRTPFIDDLDEIEDIVNDHNVKFLVIDSLGIACASRDLKEIVFLVGYSTQLPIRTGPSGGP